MHKRHIALIALLLGVGAGSADAQSLAPTMARDVGQTVELIGLRHWTRQMIKDSLAAHVPGSDTTLSTHACGEEMLQLGFVRSSAIYYPKRILVSVVEPQDSARVRVNPPLTVTAPLPPAWQQELDKHVGADGKFANGIVDFGIKWYPLKDSLRAELTSQGSKIPDQLESLWTFLAAHASENDRLDALRILRGDSALTHRTFAIGVLANFPQRDDSWGALLHTLRDRNDVPGAWLTARSLLTQWIKVAPREVNWASQTEDIRALLAGANLWTLPDVMQILTRTQIAPKLAPAILSDNAVFAFGYASSADPQAAAIGRDFLAQVSGHNHGGNVEKWQSWAKSLKTR